MREIQFKQRNHLLSWESLTALDGWAERGLCRWIMSCTASSNRSASPFCSSSSLKPSRVTVLCHQTIKINYSILFTQLLAASVASTPWDFGKKAKAAWRVDEKVDTRKSSNTRRVKLNCWLLFGFFPHPVQSSRWWQSILSQWYDRKRAHDGGERKNLKDARKHLRRTWQSLDDINDDSPTLRLL